MKSLVHKIFSEQFSMLIHSYRMGQEGYLCRVFLQTYPEYRNSSYKDLNDDQFYALVRAYRLLVYRCCAENIRATVICTGEQYVRQIEKFLEQSEKAVTDEDFRELFNAGIAYERTITEIEAGVSDEYEGKDYCEKEGISVDAYIKLFDSISSVMDRDQIKVLQNKLLQLDIKLWTYENK